MAMERDDFPVHGGVSWRSAVALLVITFLVVGLLCRFLQRVRPGAVFAQTYNDLLRMGLACRNVQDAEGRLPPAFGPLGRIDFTASVHVHLTPYIDDGNRFYTDFLAARGQGGVRNVAIPTFLSPNDLSLDPMAAEGFTSFAANLRVFSEKGVATRFYANMPPLGAIEPGSASTPTFKDGTSNTILFATKYAVCGTGGSRYASEPTSAFAPFFGQNAATMMPDRADGAAAYQLEPNAEQCRIAPLLGQSFTMEGIHVAMADTSVRTISPFVSPRTWNLLVQPNDGLEVPDDWH
jgi:hypothetical protein